MKKLMILSICIVCSFAAKTQITFQKLYVTSEYDGGFCIAQTYDGGYVITGSSESSSNNDVYLIKTDANGDTLWTKTFGGSSPDYGEFVVQTNDSGYIITGTTNSFGAGCFDVYLIKTNINGDTLWTKTYGNTSCEYGVSLAITNDSGFIIAGTTNIYGIDSSKIFLIKTDSNGDSLWTKIFTDDVVNYDISVKQTNDSGYIIVGTVSGLDSISSKAYIIKTDANGDTLWTKSYEGIESNSSESIEQTNDGGYIIAGAKVSSINGYSDVYLIKTDANGDTLWTKTIGGNYFDCAHSVVQTINGDFVIVGYTNSFGPYNIYLIKTNENGDTLWTKLYGSSFDEDAFSLAIASDNGYIITGTAWWPGALVSDVFLIKTDSNGFAYGSLGMDDVLTKTSYGLIISPNPGNRIINIKAPGYFGKIKTFEIYNLVGQLQLFKSYDFSELDISAFTSGIYFLVLTNFDNKKLTSKIIKE